MERIRLAAIAMLVLLGTIAIASAASAEILFFSYVEQGPGAIYFTFNQSSTPTPLEFTDGAATDTPVTDWTGNIGPFTEIVWWSADLSGQFNTPDNAYIVDGPQIYTGPESHPVFAPGTFAAYDESNGDSGVLTVTSTDAVPEPATWTLMLAGVGGLGAALRMRPRPGGARSAA